MKNINRIFLIVFVGLVLSASQLIASEHRKVINVTTVEQLYSAVNNAANKDAQITLAPGTYVLSSTTEQGARRPHDGSLHLLPGMSIVGSEQRVDSDFDGVPDPVDVISIENFAVFGTETTIDGSALVLPFKLRKDCGEGVTRMVPDPMIAISRNNLISSLHLIGGNNISIGEPAKPIDSTTSLSATVKNNVLEGNILAMTFANSGCQMSHAHSVLNFSNNVARNSGTGLLLLNWVTGNAANDTSNGPQIKVTATNNLFYNNGRAINMTSGNEGTDGGLITIEMTGNIFRNNGTNMVAMAAVGREPTPAVGNHVQLISRFDTFGETTGPNLSMTGGILASEDSAEPLHSDINAEFLHSKFVRDTPVNNDAPEISITGSAGGGDNHVLVGFKFATVKNSAGAPIFGKLLIQNETGLGSAPNTARIKGSRDAFLQLNQGFHAPANRFFQDK
jgi:hypothetical protein